MPFPKNVKAEARRKAHFVCVVCRNAPFVEVHHIIPESENGANDLDNAAPLCARCHDIYGNNPDLRKQLREMRDQWYEICEKRYATPPTPFYVEKLEKIDHLIEMTKTMKKGGIKNTEILKGIQDSLSELVTRAGESIRKAKTFEGVSSTASYVGTATTLAQNVHANVHCKRCGTRIGLLIGTNKCPTCGAPIE